MTTVRRPAIGVVIAQTGRLAELAEPVEFVAELFRDGPAEIILRDSRSSPDGARAATEELVRTGRVQLVLTLGGTATLPAVADTCERLGTPCLSTVLPWQVFHGGRRRTPRW